MVSDTAEFKDRVRHWAGKLETRVTSISVRSMKTNWVSYSTAGRLTFDKLVPCLPAPLQDYVIVDELLHLRVPNSGKLWESLMNAHLGNYLFLEGWLRGWLDTMAKVAEGKKLGPYSQELLDTGNQIKPYYFERELLDIYRRNPTYRVGPSSLAGGTGEGSYLQQYVSATGPNGEAAVMAISAHLDLLSPKDQELFERFEVRDGSISEDISRAIIHGEWPKETNLITALAAALKEANRIVALGRLFTIDDRSEFEPAKAVLPISHNSKPQYYESAKALHKLLADNLSHKFFDLVGITKRVDNKELGTLKRLEIYLHSLNTDEERIKSIMKPLHKIRDLRVKEAHTFIADEDDQIDFRALQNELYKEATEAVRDLCRALGRGLEGDDYSEPTHLSTPLRSLY